MPFVCIFILYTFVCILFNLLSVLVKILVSSRVARIVSTSCFIHKMNFKSFFKHQVKRIYLEDMTLDWMDLVGVSGGAALFTPWPAGTSTGRGWSHQLSEVEISHHHAHGDQCIQHPFDIRSALVLPVGGTS